MQRTAGNDMSCGCEDDKCSEMMGTMGIINEFKQLYEDKMRIIDGEGGGDCNKQAKINLQQDWIRDLTEQNEMLVRAVEELEQEATERVLALEKKLKQTSQNASQTMETLKLKDGEIDELKRKLEESLKSSCVQETEALKQSMLDMRDALTAEVADKHDTIVSLKREVQLLEDQCRKADQQTHFKDDIIKELRKEIKQFKQEIPQKSFPLIKEPILKCPVKSHRNIESFRDELNAIIVFLCEDTNTSLPYRVYVDGKPEILFKSPEIVHEYSVTYLERSDAGDFVPERDSKLADKGSFEVINAHPKKKEYNRFSTNKIVAKKRSKFTESSDGGFSLKDKDSYVLAKRS